MSRNTHQQYNGSHQQDIPDSPPTYSEIVNSGPPLPPRNMTRGFVSPAQISVQQPYIPQTHSEQVNQPLVQQHSVPNLDSNADSYAENGHYANQFSHKIQGNGYYLDEKNDPRQGTRRGVIGTLKVLSFCFRSAESMYCPCYDGRCRLDHRIDRRIERGIGRRIDRRIARLEGRSDRLT